jgi:hypothetical protein
MDSTAAKQFLISRVIEEAESEHIPLSEIEKKMLYFTERYPTLPDIYEVNDEFEREYDSDEYEEKIAGLLKKARDRDGNESADLERQWKEALDQLREEDHYILIMVDMAFGSRAAFKRRAAFGPRNRVRDFLIYVAIGIGVVLILVFASFWSTRH